MSIDRLLAAALSLRVTADTTGLEADLASKLTGAERVAVQSAARTSAAVGKIAESSAAVGVKAEAATLRASAAQETYNRLLRAGEQDTVRLARAQATALTAQASAQRELARAATPLGAGAVKEGAAASILGGARGLVGLAAGAGAFTAVKQGVTAFNDLASGVRSYQRATGDTAESSSKMVEILARFHIEGDAATQSMLRLGRNIEETPDKLTKYGVAIARSKDGTVDLTNTLLNANEAFHKTPDAATRAALVLDLFGRGGQKLLPVLSANREQLEEFVEAAQKSGRIFTQDQLVQAYKFQQASRDIHDAWQGFEIVLAKGVVPALTDASKVGAGFLDFFGHHPAVATMATRLGEVSLALVGINKAIKVFDAVRGSTLFTKVLNVGVADAATAANYRLAASEVAIGSAAAGAAPAVGALDAAEAGGGLAAAGSAIGGATAVGGTSLARIGILGRTGALARGATLGAALIDPVVAASLFVKPDNGPKGYDQLAANQRDLVSKFTYRGGRYYSGDTPITDPKIVSLLQISGVPGAPAPAGDVYGAYGESLAKKYPGFFLSPVAGDRDSTTIKKLQRQNAALAALVSDGQQAAATNAAAVQAVQQAAAGYSGSFDIFSAAPRIGANPAAVAAARQAVTSARINVGLDTQRLAALRAGNPGSQASILAAEQALAKTRDHGSPLAIAAAEARLNQLRNGGKATALQLAEAEDKLRVAKEKSATATDKLHTVEQGGVVSASEVLKNLTGQRKYVQGNAVAVAQLERLGLNNQTIASLVTQDKTTPGELTAFARTASKSLVEQINAQVKAENKASELIEAAAGTDADWQKIGRDRGAALLRGIQERIFLNAPNGGRPRTSSPGSVQSRRLRNLGTGFGATAGI